MRTKLIIIAIIAAAITLCALCARIVIQAHTIDRMESEAAEMQRQIETLRQGIADRDASIAALTAHHERTQSIHENTEQTRIDIDNAASDDIAVQDYLQAPIPGPLCSILRDRLCNVSEHASE